MKRPLKKCCNGCDAPPQSPSWVLCKECLERLDQKMHALLSPPPHPQPEANHEL